MALNNGKYGKDRPERFIDGALKGGSGPSNEIVDSKVNRPDQVIKTAFAMDNVNLVEPMESSIKDTKFGGGIENIGHSLTGGSAVNEDVGAAGKVKHVIIPNH
jgi:hypothetical protein